jgi:putative hydrolase of HD superfamily
MAAGQPTDQTVSNLFTFFKLCSKLKHLKRTGWVNHNVSNPETVAGHMYRMSMMSFLFINEPNVNQERCIKMSLVHDLAESIVGDLTPSCGVSREEKHKQEKEAMETIRGLVPDQIGEELMTLWMEYENGITPDAIIVRDLDKFDMIFQAYEYETSEGRYGELQQFFDSTKDIFKTSKVKEWAAELYKIRQNTDDSDR